MVCFQSIPYRVILTSAASNYTSALFDLEKDENFNLIDYPSDLEDNSLSVITVAESSNLLLFVYVYQPCAAMRTHVATSINISRVVDGKVDFINYKLHLVDQTGVLQKYVVEGITTVNSSFVRCYEISSIYRVYDYNIDSELEDTNGNRKLYKKTRFGCRRCGYRSSRFKTWRNFSSDCSS